MDTRRWQRSRSQVRQRQCLWVCSLVEVTAANSSIAVVPSQASPILKEIARLDALAAHGCTIDDRVYATKSICIASAFYAYTSLGRQSERIRRLLAQDAALARKAGDASEFENTLVSVVQMAYKLFTARAARSQTDIMGGQIIVSTIQSLWRALGTQLMLSHALREILELEQPDGLVTKLSEVCDRAPRCSSAQKQAFNLVRSAVVSTCVQSRLRSKPSTLSGALW